MFDFYVQHEYWFAAIQLMLAMLGMGATLTPADFREVFVDPRGFSIGIVLQTVMVPLLAWLFIVLVATDPGLAVGLAICAAIPGGTMSNVFTYLARGHVALSIALTAVATIACLITAPIILSLLVGHHMPPGFEMPAGRIALEIALTLLLPLCLGMIYLRLHPASAPVFSRWCIRGSLFVIGLIVIGALGAGRLDLKAFGIANIFILMAFIGIIAIASHAVPRLLRATPDDVIAINVELTVRNTNLGLLIKASLIPAVVGVADPIGDQALFTVLLYGGLMLLLSVFIIPRYRRGADDRATGADPVAGES